MLIFLTPAMLILDTFIDLFETVPKHLPRDMTLIP